MTIPSQSMLENTSVLSGLPASVQAVLPELAKLNSEQKLSVINLLTSQKTSFSDVSNKKPQTSPVTKEKLSPLGRKILGDVWMSDDFDDYLGDDFWFGDTIVKKYPIQAAGLSSAKR